MSDFLVRFPQELLVNEKINLLIDLCQIEQTEFNALVFALLELELLSGCSIDHDEIIDTVLRGNRYSGYRLIHAIEQLFPELLIAIPDNALEVLYLRQINGGLYVQVTTL